MVAFIDFLFLELLLKESIDAQEQRNQGSIDIPGRVGAGGLEARRLERGERSIPRRPELPLPQGWLIAKTIFRKTNSELTFFLFSFFFGGRPLTSLIR